jgi:hypothetical protein
MKRSFRWAGIRTCVTLLALAGLAGCGGSNGGSTGAGGHPGSDEHKIIGGSYRVWTNSEEGWILATDESFSAWAIRMSDGMREPIATRVQQIMFDRHFFYAWSGPGGAAPLALTVWSPQVGAKQVDSAGESIQARGSDDGSHVAWFGHLSSDGSSGDLVIASATLDAPVTAISNVNLLDCGYGFRFAGKYLLAATCPVGISTPTLTSIDLDSGAATTIASNAHARLSVDAVNQRIAYITTDGVVHVFQRDNTVWDPGITSATDVRFTPDGAGLVWIDTNGALWSQRIGAAAAQLPAPQASRLTDVSPDGRFVMFAPPATDDGEGYAIALAGGGFPGKTLVPNNAGLVLGDSFTADSQFALYSFGLDAQFNGPLWVQPTDGGTGRKLTDLTFSWIALDGGRLLYGDHLVEETTLGNGLSDGTIDLMYVDLNGTAAPKTLLSGVQATAQLTRDKRNLLYSRRTNNDAGIYLRAPGY